MRVATREASIVDNRELPDICLQHLLAVMLLQKTVTFQSAHDETLMRNPKMMHERSKIRLIPDEALEARLPAREAIVEVTLKNGEYFSEHVNAVRGTAQNPMTTKEVVVKSRDLIEPILGQAACARLIDSILQLEAVRNIRDLGPLLQPHLVS